MYLEKLKTLAADKDTKIYAHLQKYENVGSKIETFTIQCV